MKKPKKPESFLKSPYYKGGNKSMDEFIKSEMKYPEEAIVKKIEGVVVLKISIDMKGNVIQSKVEKGIGHGCDEEAVRLVNRLKFESVKLRNVNAVFFKTININFRLKDIKPIGNIIKYNYVEDKNKSSAVKSNSYTIKIDLG
ncbi:MAG: energy transducer TonB [Bacteroidota bacterium]